MIIIGKSSTTIAIYSESLFDQPEDYFHRCIYDPRALTSSGQIRILKWGKITVVTKAEDVSQGSIFSTARTQSGKCHVVHLYIMLHITKHYGLQAQMLLHLKYSIKCL